MNSRHDYGGSPQISLDIAFDIVEVQLHER